MSRAGSLRDEHGFSPTGEFVLCSFFLVGVLFSVQVTLVRKCCVNVGGLLILGMGGTVSQYRCLYLCDLWKEVLELLQLGSIP